jgi:flavodoxin
MQVKILVVFYSRTGVTRSIAGLAASVLKELGGEAVSVETEEIVDLKDRTGILGYLGAGRDAALKAEARIRPPRAKPEDFDLVVIGTPVWAFTAAPAVRTYCEQHCRNVRAVGFFCTMGGSGDRGAFQAMEAACGKKPLASLPLVVKPGKVESVEVYRPKVRRFAELLLKACLPGCQG